MTSTAEQTVHYERRARPALIRLDGRAAPTPPPLALREGRDPVYTGE